MTLSEVMAVTAILGILIILSALTLKPRYQIAKARDSRRISDLKKISTGLEDYAGDHPCYPERVTWVTELEHYMRVPKDPLTGQPYNYQKPSCSKYVIYATLELETTKTYGTEGNYVVSSANFIVVPTILPTSSPIPGTPVPTAPPPPTVTPTPEPAYGCVNFKCEDMSLVECNPRYADSNCFGRCPTPANECH